MSQPPVPPGPPIQPGGQQPGFPPGQPQAPTGVISLTVQGSMLTSNLLAPSVRINGHPVPAKYGVNQLPVYAGRTHLDVDMSWLKTYGQAGIDVDVAPGQTVPVWYAPPFHQFSRGAIGFSQQKRPGLVGFLVILAIVIVVVLAIAVGGALG